MWVTSICVSGHADGRVWVTLDGHRHDDMRPYVFVTEDRGKTWKTLAAGLPEGVGPRPVRGRRQRRPALPRDRGWASRVDRPGSAPGPGCRGRSRRSPSATSTSRSASSTSSSRPTVATWCLDVRPLRPRRQGPRGRAPPDQAGRRAPPADAVAGLLGHRHATIPNPPAVAGLYWWLGEDKDGEAQVEVLSAEGKVLWSRKEKATAGLHRTDWDLRLQAPARRGQRQRSGAPVPAGRYVVRLRVGATTQSRVFAVEDDDRPLDTSLPRPKGVGEAGPPVLGPLELEQGLGGDEDEEEQEAGDEGREREAGTTGKEVEIR
ncbi:MAG: hypothetical protein R3F30_07515 [Planctomycetota bacterium]